MEKTEIIITGLFLFVLFVREMTHRKRSIHHEAMIEQWKTIANGFEKNGDVFMDIIKTKNESIAKCEQIISIKDQTIETLTNHLNIKL